MPARHARHRRIHLWLLVFAALFLLGMASARASTEAGEPAAAGQIVLATGEVSRARQPLKAGDAVFAGDRFTTGSDGYLYIRTRDDGFIILRPHSEATLTTYHIDAQDPAQSRFRIDLHRGVARSITGDAVKAARQNFRFNTPVAAIGVKGTDFTAYTDASITRIVVLSGTVVASPFDAHCPAGGSQRCQGPAALELSAAQTGHVLQIERGRGARLLEQPQASPDHATPPRPDEPMPQDDQRAAPAPDLLPARAEIRPGERLPHAGPALQWGRWSELAQAGNAGALEQTLATHRIAALNQHFVLLRPRDTPWERPASRTLDFQLRDAQALIERPADGSTYAAQVENARLSMDFVNSRFATRLDLLADGERRPLHAEGQVFPDGTFQNVSQYLGNNSMHVDGLLHREGGTRAVYLFRSRLDAERTVYGITDWGAQELLLNRLK